jgi:threonine-phosphate decarboxylase
MTAGHLRRVIHGGVGKHFREQMNQDVLDFSASVNPYPPRFQWECSQEQLVSYPDDQYTRLKEAISSAFGRPVDEICVGNGSIEILRVFCSVVLGKKGTFFFQDPTFGEYEYSAMLAGGARAPDLSSADVAFVCNPNNPDGKLRKKDDLLAVLSDQKSHGGMLFCDEAFIDLSEPGESLSPVRDPSLFVMSSLTKSFAVPGIRIGFGFGDPALVEKIEASRSPWSVNAYAEAFAIAALPNMKCLAESRKFIELEREWLEGRIRSLGLEPLPSRANYLMIGCGKPVGPLCECLASQGILVRDCTSFGLPDHIRISVRTREDNTRLLEVLSECLR